jgi:hypothetical protein
MVRLENDFSNIFNISITNASNVAPVASYAIVYNLTPSGVTSFTVSGFNFGTVDLTPSILVSGVVCRTSSWTSVTSVLCLTGTMSTPSISVSVLVNSIYGSITSMFTYDCNEPVGYANLRNSNTDKT